MSQDERRRGEAEPADDSLPAKREESSPVLHLGKTQTLDLSGLSESQIQALRDQYARGMLDVDRKAQELRVDVGALDATLRTLSDQTRAVSDAGNNVTMSHTQTTSVGRTEVMMGNTDRARSGKLSRSQTGESDSTLIYVLIAAAVIVMLAFAIAR